MTPFTLLRPFAVAALCALSAVSPSSAQIVVKGTAIKSAPNAEGEAKAPPATERKIEPKIDPKAKAIYDRAVAETAKLETLQFDGRFSLEGVEEGGMMGLPEEMSAKTRFQMRFVRGGEPAANPMVPKASMRIETLDGALAGRVTIVHGGKAIQINGKAKTFTEGKDMTAMLVGMASGACPEWFRGGDAAAAEGEPLVLELAGTATVDDLECDLVKIVREIEFGVMATPDDAEGAPGMKTTKMPITQTVAFARADGLPRQVRSTLPSMGGPEGDEEGADMPEMPAMPTPVSTIFGLKANPKLDDAIFSIAKPEGYTEVEFQMPGMMGGMGEGGDGAMPEPPALAFKAGDAAPDFKLTGLDGKEVTLASLKGKVVLLDFWATWCGPCKAAMPTIQKLHDEYAGKDVVILGVNTWEQKPDAAKEYIAKKKFTYGCLLKGDDLATTYGISGIPTLVIIGKDGKIAEIEVGLADPTGAGLRKAIDAALKK